MTRPAGTPRFLRACVASCLGAAAVTAIGCNDDSSLEISLNNNTGAIVGSRSTSSDLTLAQGKKLLAEIRKDPARMKKLTIPERRFLAKAMAGGAESIDGR